MALDHNSENKYWHTAFYQAIRLELEDYENVLEFIPEHRLAEEPLRIDTLIIKKAKGVTVGKNFGQIFRAANVLEFKSPRDYVSVKDFYKVYAYACLYAAITPDVDITDMTLSFIETRYPRKLIRHLQEVRHYRITEPWPGIYRVIGDFLPIQILESKKLSNLDNVWLKGLNTDLDIKSTSIILEKSREKGKNAPIQAYLDLFLRANARAIQEAVKMTNRLLTLEEALTEIGLLPKWLEQGREQGREETARKMKVDGLPIDKIITYTGLSVTEIDKL